MQFETSIVLEDGLRAIDDAILKTLRRKWNRHLRIKHNPCWIHRKIEKQHIENEVFLILVRGHFECVLDHAQVVTLHTDITAEVIKKRGQAFVGTVSGIVAQEIGYGEQIQIS